MKTSLKAKKSGPGRIKESRWKKKNFVFHIAGQRDQKNFEPGLTWKDSFAATEVYKMCQTCMSEFMLYVVEKGQDKASKILASM